MRMRFAVLVLCGLFADSVAVFAEPLPQQSAAKQDAGPRDGEQSPDYSPPRWPLPKIDDARVGAMGIRSVAGRHFTLYTDLPASEAVDELPKVFDAAVPQWCEYFRIPPQAAQDWHLVAYVIGDKDRFRKSGLLPDNLPPFLHGYQRFAEIWVYEQPSDYYRRHLVLHEGTHAFMHWALGGAGPPWYMEGMAELLATHEWSGGELRLGVFPGSKQQTPQWGRIKIIQDDVAANRGKTIKQVTQYDVHAHLQVEPYAWCWATAAFFQGQAAYRQSFQRLFLNVRSREGDFTRRFAEGLRGEWGVTNRQWELFVREIDYGYDLEREAIEMRPSQPLLEGAPKFNVAADRGWQSTGLQLAGGQRYRVEASGRFQLDDRPSVWWCEANGVTIHYFRGFPLGMLLGAVVDEQTASAGVESLLHPEPIGARAELQPARGGTLYLRINDRPSSLCNNAGRLDVVVQKLPD